MSHEPRVPSQDKPKFGPEFQEWKSTVYRAEYAAGSIVILAYLVWKELYGGGIDVFQIIFWAVFPDLAAFLPIGIASKGKEWPSWGPMLYNTVHTFMAWGLVFGIAWLGLRSPYLPLLGWLRHITTDRAVGYGLRKRD